MRNLNIIRRTNALPGRRRAGQIIPYAHCRLNPWAGMPSNGIPDDSDVRRIVVDHRYITPFKFGSTGIINIAVLPCFPFPVLANAALTDVGFQMNGIIPNSHIGDFGLFFGSCVPEWYAIQNILYATTGEIDELEPLYAASSARIVTMAFRIVYTGSTMENSGFLKINRETFSLGSYGNNPVTFTQFGGNGVDTNFGAQQVKTFTNNTQIDFTRVTPDAFEGRLSKGAYCVLKHNGATFHWVPVYDNVAFIQRDLDSRNGMIMPLAMNDGQVGTCGNCQFFDNDWSGASIQITGGTVGQTFNLELIACIEYAPKTSSNVSQLAKQPPTNMAAVEATNLAAKHAPVAAENVSPFAKAASAVKTTVDTAKSIGSVVSALGAVAA